MSESRSDRVKKLFLQAQELDAEDRQKFLREAAGGDDALREEVETLLDVQPPGAGVLGKVWSENPDENAPRQVGPYKLLEKLGEGGMGEVWLVQQTEPVQRKVALKIIKRGMDTKKIVARFEAERQAMAMMDHPCVAKVFDAGVTSAGLPYFVMEYVQGVPITEHCDRHRLTMQQRLELFARVCEGVQHAHHKAVIHRDIKPSNVLVSYQDGRAMPKIIDFGVAKATAQPLTEKTLFTESGVLIGTPEYMSPEQADLTGQNIDTRTDVYSLGVMLYELLTGALPFESKELRESGYAGICKKIREVEPSKPSTRVATLDGHRSAVSAEQRHTDSGSLERQLRGDLDWITMRAIEKERSRRYDSPIALAEDIRRHIGSQPVHAGPPSNVYKLRKFVNRHRAGVAMASLVSAALIAGAIGTAMGLVRALRAERVAVEESATAKQVTSLLLDTFRSSNPFLESKPGVPVGELVTARQVLEQGSDRIRSALHDRPVVRAELLDTLGQVHMDLGLLAESADLLEEALEIRRSLLGGTHPDTGRTLVHIAELRANEVNAKEAERLAREALEILRAALGEEHLDVAESLRVLGLALIDQRRMDDAEVPIRQGLAIVEGQLGSNHEIVGAHLEGLASLLAYQNQWQEAIEVSERALEIYETKLGPEHPRIVPVLGRLGDIYSASGNFEEYNRLLYRQIEIWEATLGPEHPEMVQRMMALASIVKNQGEPEKAKEMMLEGLAKLERHFGDDHPSLGYPLYRVASFLRSLREYEDAETMARRSVEAYEKAGQVPYIVWFSLARTLMGQERYEEAEDNFRMALVTGEDQMGPDYPLISWVLLPYARLCVSQQRYGEAERMTERALGISKNAHGEEHREVAWAVELMGTILEAQGRTPEAETFMRRAIRIYDAIGWTDSVARVSADLESLLENG